MKNKLLISILFASTLLLSACGGGGGNSNEPTSNNTISGIIITDDPISGAQVKILTLSSSEITSTTTDADGKYSVEVASGSIDNGYIVEASGGQLNDENFVGTLRGIYSASDDKTKANATLITSLIAKLAMDDSEISRNGTLLTKRDTAIQKLVDIGMLKKADWFVEEPELVDMYKLGVTAQTQGVDTWLNQMFTDLSDGQLTRDKIRIFTNAHGGLLRSLPSSEFVSVFPGQTETVSITHEFQENTKSVTVNKISGPDWVTVEDEKLIIAPSSEQTDYGDFTVKLENSVDGVALGRTNEVVVSLLKKVVLVSGELGSAGGIIENEWQDISISVEAGKLSQTYQIEYNAGLTTNGKLSLWTIITPEMNAEEMSYIELKQPSLDSIKINYLQQSEDL